MKRFHKIYLEITNCCNLQCAFCPGTKRTPHVMDTVEFTALLPKLQPWTDYLYFHLMGEPLCHPHLKEFLDLTGEAGFKVILTTNGTLLSRWQETLLQAGALHKVNISLHAFEANDLNVPFEQYLHDCFSFGQRAEGRLIVSYRLWNNGGSDRKNEEILDAMRQYFPLPWQEGRLGPRLGQQIYLQYGDQFDWPDLSAQDYGDRVFCYGLKDQIGVLCDGTVVPCCLDHEGDIALGNLFRQDLGEILDSDRAQAMIHGFSEGRASEALCRKCGYAKAKFG